MLDNEDLQGDFDLWLLAELSEVFGLQPEQQRWLPSGA